MPQTINDTDLIHRVLAGDQKAFAPLVDQYKDYAFTLALKITGNREDAEEVAQDAFIKAYRALRDFRMESKFSTWLYTIVHTTALSFLRKKKPDLQSLDNERVFDSANTLDSGSRANQVEQKSRQQMVTRAIALLNPDDARVITLFYQLEQSIDEMARILGIETNAAKVRLHRARGRLKEKMITYFAEEVSNLR